MMTFVQFRHRHTIYLHNTNTIHNILLCYSMDIHILNSIRFHKDYCGSLPEIFRNVSTTFADHSVMLPDHGTQIHPKQRKCLGNFPRHKWMGSKTNISFHSHMLHNSLFGRVYLLTQMQTKIQSRSYPMPAEGFE